MEHNDPLWSYDWLPVEILEMVILDLSDFTSFRNSRLVNSLWYTVTHDLSPTYWKLKYDYCFGGPKEEGKSDEDAFSKNQKDIIKLYKQVTGSGFGSRIMVEQSLTSWARNLGHKGFVQHIVLHEKRLNELLSVPNYSEKLHSQWYTSTKDSEGRPVVTASKENQRANRMLSRQEMAERKKQIAMHNYFNNAGKK